MGENVKYIVVAICIVGVLALGYFIMKKIDDFLENNSAYTADFSDEDKTTDNIVCIFLNNTKHPDALEEQLEMISQRYPDTEISICTEQTENFKKLLQQSRNIV